MNLRLTVIALAMLLTSALHAATVSKSFTATGAGADYLRVRHNDKFTYDVSGTFVGTVILEVSKDSGATWNEVDRSTAADSGTVLVETNSGGAAYYRYRCSAFTSGTIVTAIADATADVPQEKVLYNRFGDAIGSLTEAGIAANSLEVSGAFSVAGVTSLPNGTLAAPALAFTSDPDLGLYRVSANNIGIAATTVTIPGALSVTGSTSSSLTLGNSRAAVGNGITNTSSSDFIMFYTGSTLRGHFNPSGVFTTLYGGQFDGQLIAKGTATNDNAATGYIGEYVESLVTTYTNFPSSGTWGDITSISLTAGDWDVTGLATTFANGATIVSPAMSQLGISTTSGNSSTGLVDGVNQTATSNASTTGLRGLAIPAYRMSLSATTTVYLKINAAYTTATPQYVGRLSARRMR